MMTRAVLVGLAFLFLMVASGCGSAGEPVGSGAVVVSGNGLAPDSTETVGSQADEYQADGNLAAQSVDAVSPSQVGASGAVGASGVVDSGDGAPPPDFSPVLTQEDVDALFIEEFIAGLSLEAQVSQLFIIALGDGFSGVSDGLSQFVMESMAGGYVLFGSNITTVEGTRALTGAIREVSAVAPFICIDEEGGVVSRLNSAGLPGYAAQPSARSVGATGDAQNASVAGEAIGSVLSSIGVNVNFAPVADVLTNPQNTAIGSRSFGSDPDAVSDMVSAFQAGLHSQGIMSAPKHFPGHGNTARDTHFGPAIVASDLEHLAAVEFVPFARAIREGAEFVMVGHITAPEAEPGGLPASLSRFFVTDVLRGELGFGGIVVTDAMNMAAVAGSYAAGEAAVLALMAGVDMILMPEDFQAAVDGVLQAARDGVLPAGRIHESLLRIFSAKLAAGMLGTPG